MWSLTVADEVPNLVLEGDEVRELFDVDLIPLVRVASDAIQFLLISPASYTYCYHMDP